jgi:hypothetical protein
MTTMHRLGSRKGRQSALKEKFLLRLVCRPPLAPSYSSGSPPKHQLSRVSFCPQVQSLGKCPPFGRPVPVEGCKETTGPRAGSCAASDPNLIATWRKFLFNRVRVSGFASLIRDILWSL